MGIFYLDHLDNVNKTGIIYNGKLTIYSNIYAFIDSIYSLCANHGSPAMDGNDLVLLIVLSKCFQGAAKEWWVTELFTLDC